MKLSLLVQAWRDRATCSPSEADMPYCRALALCADELEAALAQQAQTNISDSLSHFSQGQAEPKDAPCPYCGSLVEQSLLDDGFREQHMANHGLPLAQQAQPEMPTRGEIAMTLASIDYPKLEWEQVASCAAEIYLLQADAALALFAPKEPE